jgi:hypothetical protein
MGPHPYGDEEQRGHPLQRSVLQKKIRGVGKGDILSQAAFISHLFAVAA